LEAAASLAELLGCLGFRASVERCGRAALVAAERDRPDVVVLELRLPDLDGWEVARRLRAAGCRSQIVALTTCGLAEDRERSRATGIDAHLLKPAGAAELLAALIAPSDSVAARGGVVGTPHVSTIRLLVADGHPVAREGLKALLNAQPGMRVVGEAGDGPSALARAAQLTPDVVVTELGLPGPGGGEVVARLLAQRPARRVLALTACEDAGALGRALAAGARGYVLKRSSTGAVVRAIRAVAAGGAFRDPAGAAVGCEERGGELSARDAEVLCLAAWGYSNKQIATRLKVSVKSVETYKARAMEKLGIRTRVELVRYAYRLGWFGTGARP
jgi:DNA-binding NarL/FixJ family response regulator